jgi:hypothetical protein
MQPTDVAELLNDLLDQAVAALDTTEAAVDAPVRRFISHSEPSYDCEQLTVHLVSVTPKPVDPRGDACVLIPVARVAVTLLRCVTALEDEGMPDHATLQAENHQLAIDGPALFKYLTRQWAEGTWPSGLPCRAVKWRALEPKAPAGGYAGWRIEADIEL